MLYKQTDGVAMSSPLEPNLLMHFYLFMKKSLELCSDEITPVCYRRYVDIFVLFKSQNHLNKFRYYLTKCHTRMKLSLEQERNGKLSFLNVEVSHTRIKFVTTVYRKYY